MINSVSSHPREPRTENREPRTENREPRTENREPPFPFTVKCGPSVPDTKAAVEKAAQGVLLRADFPLVLRKFQGDKIIRSATAPIIRAGQYLIITSINAPEPNGNVYVQVKVMHPPGGN